ncbi:MAG TPA: hypothetical protein DCS97_07495 [Planctomycetes bacterium]|nr:hypothetical protein [Planctomycetota bacterium]
MNVHHQAPQAPSSAPPSAEQGHPHIDYVPGYVLAKVGMITLGLLLLGLSSIELVPKVRLLLVGTSAQAEAVRVVKTRAGDSDRVFTDDASLLAAQETRDRRYVFWNEYRFPTQDGAEREFRAPVGSQLKASYPLRDAAGLPTVIPICYDPAQPSRVILPSEFSTWFLPGFMAACGLVTMAVGSLLLYFARRPVAMPDLSAAAIPPR